jgi:hypothetical protein
MAEPSDTPEPDPPLAHRADDDSVSDSTFDSGYDSRFDSDEADRRADAEAKRRQRTILIIVLVATLTPFAICGLVFLGCTALLARSG